ncbi:YqjF family protein [Chryseosolibacter indicus]|uniref:DUF2071 domain-containing protein n=1 Tax=Chryseosolibacter indicus TaxID=2782351 RepID=A0ABS5VMX6_9BACT|nr:DUF2071 domain-containing protein [Chryseosolibacter indicus]
MKTTFLEAEWRKLAIVNYAIDKSFLLQYLPHKTELDTWNNTCYISLVGFMFLNTKVKGIKIPFHVNFEEVNLRFYVKHKYNNEWKRGVVFIKEIVPKTAITVVANTIYKENYETMKMAHEWLTKNENLSVEYRWKKNHWNVLKVQATNQPWDIENGSEEEFITEHFWGYTYINKSKTSEYEVEHPRWKVYKVNSYSLEVNFADIYGSSFNFLTTETPKSVFLAEGSSIVVRGGTIL